MFSFFKTTVIGGLLFMVPFAVLVIVFEKITPIAKKIVQPIADLIPAESFVGLDVPVILTVIAILLLCFLIGLFARTRIATRLIGGMEQSVLRRIPGYSFLKTVSSDIADDDGKPADRVVLVQFDDAWQLGLKVDELNEGRFATVFIPDSPTPETGSVMIVSADRVVPANLSLVSAFSCLKARGAGISNILKTQERA